MEANVPCTYMLLAPELYLKLFYNDIKYLETNLEEKWQRVSVAKGSPAGMARRDFLNYSPIALEQFALNVKQVQSK